MLISLIVPCYNEEDALPYFYDAIVKVSEEMREYEFEYIFVNDGSKDKTLELLRSYAEKDARATYISFSRNFGKEAAMYAGFVNAKGDYVAVMDADMQDPPSLLPDMVKYLESGEFDSVATRRFTRKGEPVLRSAFARLFYKLINKISDADIVDGARDFRLMTRPMVDAIVSMSEASRFSKGIFGWIGFRTKWLPYENVERVAGKTKWSFGKLFKYALDGFVDFSDAPLNFVAGFGVFMTIVSFVALLFVFIRALVVPGISVEGWASTICIVLFLGGIQLLCLGIIGKYLAKTYREVKHRPHYLVSESNRKDVVGK